MQDTSFLSSFIKTLNEWLTGPFFMFFLVSISIFYTFYLGFPQVRYCVRSIKLLFGVEGPSSKEGDVSAFEVLSTSLAGSIGVGSITGVAIAVHIGGPSSLVWMWVIALIGMATRVAETALSHFYREKSDGKMVGGPMYVMERRLKMPFLAMIFSLGTVMVAFLAGNMPQINTVASVLDFHWGFPKLWTGLILSIVVGIVIIGGVERIAKVTSFLVPFMGFIYLMLVGYVLVINYDKIGEAFALIFRNTFRRAPAIGGFVGSTVSVVVFRGFKCGFLTNEAGMGSTSISHCASKESVSGRAAIMSMIEPFIATCVLCTLTTLSILVSGSWQEKVFHTFDRGELMVVVSDDSSAERVRAHFYGEEKMPSFTGGIVVEEGLPQDGELLFLHNDSIAEGVMIEKHDVAFSGILSVVQGRIVAYDGMVVKGKSLLTGAKLALHTFENNEWGWLTSLLMMLCLLLFALSTVISCNYYGLNAVIYLLGKKYVSPYRVLYVICSFLGAIISATIIWEVAITACAMMAIPNLITLWYLRKEVKDIIKKA